MQQLLGFAQEGEPYTYEFKCFFVHSDLRYIAYVQAGIYLQLGTLVQ